MSQLTFNITLQRHGEDVMTATVPAHEAGIVGDWYQGKPYQPKAEEVRAAIPFHYRPAFSRRMEWWETTDSGRKIPLKCELRNLKNQLIGTLYATPNWEAI